MPCIIVIICRHSQYNTASTLLATIISLIFFIAIPFIDDHVFHSYSLLFESIVLLINEINNDCPLKSILQLILFLITVMNTVVTFFFIIGIVSVVHVMIVVFYDCYCIGYSHWNSYQSLLSFVFANENTILKIREKYKWCAMTSRKYNENSMIALGLHIIISWDTTLLSYSKIFKK